MNQLQRDELRYLFGFLRSEAPLLRLVCKRWAENIAPSADPAEVVDYLLGSGKVALLRRCNIPLCCRESRGIECAARQGDLRTLSWLVQKYGAQSIPETAAEAAALNHQYLVLRALCTYDCPKTAKTTTYLASAGDYEMLVWAHSVDFPCDDSIRQCTSDERIQEWYRVKVAEAALRIYARSFNLMRLMEGGACVAYST